MTDTAHDESVFRIVFVVIFCTSLATLAFHRMAARTGEPLNRREEGIWVFAVLRLSGLLAGLCALAYVLHPAGLAWAQIPLPSWMRWSGAAIGVLCSALFFWTLRHLGKNLTDTVVTRTDATLVTTGPYRWVRHPFYVAAALLFFSSFLVTANWLLGLTGVVVMTILAARTRTEEQHLLHRFGTEYRAYSERTGRFIPRLRG